MEVAQFEVEDEDEDMGDQILTKLLLSVFIVMTLVIFSMNVPIRVSQAHFVETFEPLLLMAYVEEMVEQKEDSKVYVAQPLAYVAPQ